VAAAVPTQSRKGSAASAQGFMEGKERARRTNRWSDTGQHGGD